MVRSFCSLHRACRGVLHPLRLRPNENKEPRNHLLVFVLLGAFGVSSRSRTFRTPELRISSTFAPDSSHILIGDAEQRRVGRGAGIQPEHGETVVRLDYEALSPVLPGTRSDACGEYSIIAGYRGTLPSVASGHLCEHDPVEWPVGRRSRSRVSIYGSTKTYAFAMSPIGARISGFSSHRFNRPFQTIWHGIFLAGLPVDDSASVNFLFSFGPA